MQFQSNSGGVRSACRTNSVLSSKLTFAIASLIGVGFACAAPVDNVPDSNSNGKIDLADVIAAGGFTIGDKHFSDFSYTPSGANSPSAADISVDVSPGSTADDEAVRFGFGWFTIDGINMDSRLDYTVSVVDRDPNVLIDGVDLLYNGISNGQAQAVVAETIQDANGGFLGLLHTTSDPSDPAVVLALVPPQKTIKVDKDIQLFSLPGTNGAHNFASISFVDNSYHQTVPEPVSAGILGLGCLTLMRRRRAM